MFLSDGSCCSKEDARPHEFSQTQTACGRGDDPAITGMRNSPMDIIFSTQILPVFSFPENMYVPLKSDFINIEYMDLKSKNNTLLYQKVDISYCTCYSVNDRREEE